MHQARSLGKYSERTAGNHFWAQIRVPDDARDELYATVKLPKHGLQKKSSPLAVVPPVQISNAKWDKSEARRGEHGQADGRCEGSAGWGRVGD